LTQYYDQQHGEGGAGVGGRGEESDLPESQVGNAEAEASSSSSATSASASKKRPRDMVVLDVRNRKEFKLGHFKGATDPDIKNQARWVPDFADEAAEKWASEGTKVLMYCTGGIRCEKASAFLRSKGVADVFQLSGGIHRYLEKYGAGGHFQVRGQCIHEYTAVGRV
jgi:predicted sulfurtransferase